MSAKRPASKKPSSAPGPAQSRKGESAAPAQTNDDRFSFIGYDPRFKSLPKKNSKVRIEARFKSMFNDDRFNPKFAVDKRGRKLDPNARKEDLSRFYQLASDEDDGDDSEDDDDEEEEEEEQSSGAPKSKSKPQQIKRQSSFKAIAANIRGDAGLSSSSSDDDDDDGNSKHKAESSSEESDDGEDDDDEEQVEMVANDDEDVWNLEDPNSVPLGETVTRRLAVCNLDWDHLRAVDLLVLFNSFKPAGGVIKSVTIYPSRFGVKRMAVEDKQGPFAALAKNLSDDENSGDESGDENAAGSGQDETVPGGGDSKERTNKLLRKYQLSRLRYYYAIIECDSPDTANAIYDQCDGLELESTSNTIDLRFVPDEETFTDFPPRDAASEVPASGFRPPEFYSSALQSSKVKLTWDEDDDQRVAITRRKFNRGDFQENDVRAYLASGSSGSEDEAEGGDSGDDDDSAGTRSSSRARKEDVAAKYRELLAGFKGNRSANPSAKHHSSGEEDYDQEMTITFEPGLKAAAEDALKRKQQREKLSEMSVWERHLEAKREKKREKRRASKAAGKADGAGSGSSDDEDEDRIDMSDPFFRDEIVAIERSNQKAAQRQQKQQGATGKKAKELLESEEKEKARQRAELELLMLDENQDGTHSKHFSLKKILENEKNGGKKTKKGKGKGKGRGINSDNDDDGDSNDTTSNHRDQDNFKVNLVDPRFKALFELPEYSIDPTNPKFKKTKAMQEILDERMKRRLQTELAKDERSKPRGGGSGAPTASSTLSSSSSSSSSSANAAGGPQRKLDPNLSLLVNSVKRKAQDRLQSEAKKPRL